ncbi:MAG: acetyl-CoA carboxylase, biotin carboxyl carrier protein [Verrucomicrobia bacterium Tous-C9LFEB]|nr:MAG: acetyl-CoA carboxylase, biotin carboxyl carrier protein [Verrucomicrobia bacterium Tous-C9LFEB]
MDLKEIKAVIDLMTKNGLSEFELEKPEFKIRVRRGADGEVSAAPVVYSAPAPAPLPQVSPAAANAVANLAASASAAKDPALKQILSPMVGTFYRSPSPDSSAYVEVGQEVNEDTVVCIIEAMKVMNEIKAEMKGVIVEVLAQSNKPVEFGKPLFAIKPL